MVRVSLMRSVSLLKDYSLSLIHWVFLSFDLGTANETWQNQLLSLPTPLKDRQVFRRVTTILSLNLSLNLSLIYLSLLNLSSLLNLLSLIYLLSLMIDAVAENFQFQRNLFQFCQNFHFFASTILNKPNVKKMKEMFKKYFLPLAIQTKMLVDHLNYLDCWLRSRHWQGSVSKKYKFHLKLPKFFQFIAAISNLCLIKIKSII